MKTTSNRFLFSMFAVSMLTLGFVSCQSTPRNATVNRDLAQYESVVSIAVDAVNSKNSDTLLEHLSPRFNILGIGGYVARLGLEGMYQRLDDGILTYDLVNVEENRREGLLTLTYDVVWKSSGPEEANFVFETASGLLRTLYLFPSKHEPIEFEATVDPADLAPEDLKDLLTLTPTETSK